MKDSNFDSIKEKFDNSGVNAPEAVNEKMVLDKLENAQPVQLLPPKKSKKKAVAGISAAAAAVALVTAGAIILTSVLNKPPVKSQPMIQAQLPAGLKGFKTRGEITETLKQLQKLKDTPEYINYEMYNDDGASSGNSSSGSSSSGGSASNGSSSSGGVSSDAMSGGMAGALPDTSSHNSTYVQSVGVDEADTVKTTDKYIFYTPTSFYGIKQSVTVFSAEGKDAKQVAEITPRWVDADGYIIDFFICGERLVMLSGVTAYLNVPADKGSLENRDEEDSGYVWRSRTEVTVYDISDINSISIEDTFSQSGDYVSSRMIDNLLYVVTTDYVNHYGDSNFCLPFTGSASKFRELPAQNICSVERPIDDTFLVVSCVDIDKGAQVTKTKAVLGSGDTVYCNTENLYVTAYEYAPDVYNAMLNGTGDRGETASPDETEIIKISLEKDIEFVASGRVPGLVNNNYSLDEYNGSLRIATTSYTVDGGTVNSLFVLDGNLNQTGQVTDIAKGESIKAVRYINETAYVITYEQTDPLFVIDVADPARPKVLGEVKISGFSTMLVPVDENTLLGIGYYTEDHADDDIDMEIQEGVKLVTFDVSDKSSPKVLDEKSYVDYGSAVQGNPKALLVNFERGDYSIPMRYYHYDPLTEEEENAIDYQSYEEWEALYRQHTQTKAGLLNFRVENGKIIITDDYTSPVFDGYDSTPDRCVYVGANQYLLGTTRSSSSESDMDTDPVSAIECVPYK